MIYFKHPMTSEVFAFETLDEREEFGAPELIEMDDEETAQHLAGPPAPSAHEQIEALERQHMLPRATREFMLTFMEATAIQQGAGQGLTAPQAIAALRAGNSGYRKVKELDEQIAALRGQP